MSRLFLSRNIEGGNGRAGNNTSWALVTMANQDAIEAVLAAKVKARGRTLLVTKYDDRRNLLIRPGILHWLRIAYDVAVGCAQ
jgi:hypothetical protein